MNKTYSAERLKPLTPPISTKKPSKRELEISQNLRMYMEEKYPTETKENLTKREIILATLTKIFRDWVKQTCVKKGLSEELAAEAGGKIYTSGSYRLGVHEPGADIDTICVAFITDMYEELENHERTAHGRKIIECTVQACLLNGAPKHVNREDFFSSLKAVLLERPEVENLVSIEGAVVPIMTFDFSGVNIDLLFAVLPLNSIPPTVDIDSDLVLRGVDLATEKSVNGPRVTNMIIQLVPSFETFLRVLRCVRIWAKLRGLYSNKMGYLGGVNWGILVAFVSQLYPTACPSTLLQKLFLVLSKWKWPSPIQLCKSYDANLGLDVWNPLVGANRFHVMPIITPAYPSMNSSVSVSRQSLQIMQDEFENAREAISKIVEEGGKDWSSFYQPSEFFIRYNHYLAIDIYAAAAEDEQAWIGYVESRLRKLVDGLAYLPLRRIQIFPKKFELSDAVKQHNGVCYFIGFEIDKLRIQGNKLNIDSAVSYFRSKDVYAWPKRTEGMEVKITPFAWKSLPSPVFESLGGAAEAKRLRKELRARAQSQEEERIKRAKEASEAALAESRKRKTRDSDSEGEHVEETMANVNAEVEKEARQHVPTLPVCTPTASVPADSDSEPVSETVVSGDEAKKAVEPAEVATKSQRNNEAESAKKAVVLPNGSPSDSPTVDGSASEGQKVESVESKETSSEPRALHPDSSTPEQSPVSPPNKAATTNGVANGTPVSNTAKGAPRKVIAKPRPVKKLKVSLLKRR